jgi:hypothetical protein
MKEEDSFCLKSHVNLVLVLWYIVGSLPHRSVEMGYTLGDVGLATQPLLGQRLCPFLAQINPEDFLPLPVFWLLFLSLQHAYNPPPPPDFVSPSWILSLTYTWFFLGVPMPASVTSSTFQGPRLLFFPCLLLIVLFLRDSQWEPTSWLVSSLLAYKIPCFSIPDMLCLLPASCWFLAWLNLPWIWRRYAPPRLTFAGIHGVTPQKRELFGI